MTSCSKYQDYRENQRRDNFNKNFDAFQKLEGMQREDKNLIYAIHFDKVYEMTSSEKIKIERVAIYRIFMKRAGLKGFGYIAEEPKKRMVRFYDTDSVDSGYVYMEHPPPKFFRKFSECEPIMPTHSCYILLRKNWYMFQEWARLEQK